MVSACIIEGALFLFWTRGNLFWVNCCFSVYHEDHCFETHGENSRV
jgi:hypothetical protein